MLDINTAASQEERQRRTLASLVDMAVTPTLCVDPERELSSPANVPLASMVMDAHVTVIIASDVAHTHCSSMEDAVASRLSPLTYLLLSSKSNCSEP